MAETATRFSDGNSLQRETCQSPDSQQSHPLPVLVHSPFLSSECLCSGRQRTDLACNMEGACFTCFICKKHRAEVFCICSDLPLLCTGCRPEHETKPDFHFALAVGFYDSVNPHNQLEVKLWLMRLKSSQDKLRKNMQEFDQCKADILSTSLNIQRELAAFTDQTVRTLEGLREVLSGEIEQAVQETSANACRSDYQPQTYLAGLIMQDCYNPSAGPLPVFTYAVQPDTSVQDCLGVSFHTPVPHLSNFNYLARSQELQTKLREAEVRLEEGKNRETDLLRRQQDLHTQLKEAQLLLEEGKSADVRNTQLVAITETALRYFDIQAGTWQPWVNLEQQIDINPRSSTWVVLEGGGIFVCYGQQAWVLSGSGAVVCSTRMREERYYPGVISLPNTPVLIFGGYYHHHPYALTTSLMTFLNSCEKFQLSNHQTTALPPMQQPRAFFNPCEWRGLVYLCGGDLKGGSLEAFSPETEAFLAFLLPLPEESYPGPCCVYVDRDVLVVHSYSHITKFRTGERRQPVQLSVTSPLLDKRQNSQPVLDKTRQVCYLVWKGECMSFGMETGELIARLG